MRFRFTEAAIDTAAARRELLDRGAGGYSSFEGWVRDHNEGQEVTALEYEAFQELGVKEGERILVEALRRFPIKHAACIHRVGSLTLSDMAVWVGVSSAHRGEAFDACRFIIDEVKRRLPIWKKEHYRSGDSGWVNCERCAAAPQHDHPIHDAHPAHPAHPAHDAHPANPTNPTHTEDSGNAELTAHPAHPAHPEHRAHSAEPASVPTPTPTPVPTPVPEPTGA